LLKKFDDKEASINGATQIRAGVLRPEIVIPQIGTDLREIVDFEERSKLFEQGLQIGSPIRIIREPFFGEIGVVSQLPVELQTLDTESGVRVLEAELTDNRKVIVPRANVEIIEE
ncbi:MAG: hypothetical protein JSV51_07300, partial [Candidatus Bathyarchaeota archaeon]